MLEEYTIFVPQETLRKAKEKGCPIESATVLYFYGEQGDPHSGYKIEESDELCDVHAYQLIGWLRDCRDIQVSIGETFNSDYKYKCVAYKESDRDHSKVALSSYYEIALLDGLNQALDLI